MNIYVGNLPQSIDRKELKCMFATFGDVEEAKVITDHRTKQPKGYGFVEMPSNSEADQAIKALNGKFISGCNIKVKPADSGRKRSKRSSSKRRRY